MCHMSVEWPRLCVGAALRGGFGGSVFSSYYLSNRISVRLTGLYLAYNDTCSCFMFLSFA